MSDAKKPVKESLKQKGKDMKKRIKDKLKGTVAVVSALIVLAVISGCQSLVPSARSNQTKYGDIARIDAGGNVTLNITIGDGLLASADGGGDSQSNTPTQTTDTKPEIAVGVGGGSAGTGGATPTAGLTDKIMSALKSAGIVNAGNSEAAAKAVESTCSDGSCTPK